MDSALAQMQAAYQDARAFLAMTPGLPMSWLRNLETLPPTASLGSNRRADVNAQLRLAPSLRLVLLGFGGVAYQGGVPGSGVRAEVPGFAL